MAIMLHLCCNLFFLQDKSSRLAGRVMAVKEMFIGNQSIGISNITHQEFQHHLKTGSCSSKTLQNLLGVPRRLLGELPHAFPQTFEQTLKSEAAFFIHILQERLLARGGERFYERDLLEGKIDPPFVLRLFLFFCTAAKTKHKNLYKSLERCCSDNQFGFSIAEQRLMRNTSAAPWGSLLLMLSRLQPLQQHAAWPCISAYSGEVVRNSNRNHSTPCLSFFFDF